MTWTSLDHIVRSVLNQKGYTIHWYFQYLKYAADCYRELHYDALRVIQTVKLPVNAHRAIPLPCDYVDWVKVGIARGQVVRPLVQANGINRLNQFNDAGEITTYTGTTTDEQTGYWASSNAWDVVTNDYGEHVGRDFGFRNSNMADGFKVLRERSEIQLSESVNTDFVILEYISDGTGLSNAATRVDPFAQVAIETYVKWQAVAASRDDINSREAVTHWASVRKLKARKNPLRIEDIKRSLNKNRHALK
jgi:hypothetical protein